MKNLVLWVMIAAFFGSLLACATGLVSVEAPMVGAGNDACTVTGNGQTLLLKGIVMAPNAVYSGEVAVFGNTIACVGMSCAGSIVGGATIVNCPGALISPGLINPHDHITYNQHPPTALVNAPFDHRNEWRREFRPGPSYDANVVAWSELRQLISGTTSVASSGGVRGLLRNVGRPGLMEAGFSNAYTQKYNVFPLSSNTSAMYNTGCLLYDNRDTPAVLNSFTCYLPHVAEGVNQAARNEFLCMSSTNGGGYVLTSDHSAFIHTVAGIQADAAVLNATHTKMVWSPRSNISLYGNTAPVALYNAAGVTIAMSSDWTPSGSISLLRELNCASSVNRDYLHGYFTNQHLWEMVTSEAAEALGISNQVGSLAPGLLADISVYRMAGPGNAYDAFVGMDSRDVALVLRGGRAMFGDSSVINGLTQGGNGCYDMPDPSCTALGLTKKVCPDLASGADYQALAASNGGSYPLFICNTPTDEPSCLPARTQQRFACRYTGIANLTDADGDGVPNLQDNCPAIFNPSRPVDQWPGMVNCVQPDYSALGWACAIR